MRRKQAIIHLLKDQYQKAESPEVMKFGHYFNNG